MGLISNFSVVIPEKAKLNYITENIKARFRRRTFHEPNLIRIKVDPNHLDRLN